MHARVINELELSGSGESTDMTFGNGNARLSCRFIEGTLRILEATCKERTPKDEKEVRQDRSEHLRQCQMRSRTRLCIVYTEVCTILNWSAGSGQLWSQAAQKRVALCRRAATPTIISTAFPKEAFSSPDRVWPSLSDIWSVAVPRSCRRFVSEKSDYARVLAHRRQRHNCDKTEAETVRSVPFQVFGYEAQGNKYEQHVEPGAKEEETV